MTDNSIEQLPVCKGCGCDLWDNTEEYCEFCLEEIKRENALEDRADEKRKYRE